MRKHVANSQAMLDNQITYYMEECDRISTVLDSMPATTPREATDDLYDELSRIDQLMTHLVNEWELIGTK